MSQKETELKVGRTDLYKVPFSLLRVVEGRNPRIDFGDIDGLVESIRENGVKLPLSGRKDADGFYYIKDGGRRYKAMEILYKEGIEVLAPFWANEGRGANEEQILADMVLSNGGKEFTPLELAIIVKRYVNWNWELKDIAKRLGMDKTYPPRLLRLANAPKKFQNMVQRGTISATTAMKILTKDGAAEEFLESYDKGDIENPNAGEETNKSQKRITARDLTSGVNSFKELKSFLASGNKKDVKKEHRPFYELLLKLINNEVTVADFEDFFPITE
jgi:ParB/RepB/Spo0J family partition protein